MPICGIYRKVFPGGNCESVPISAVPAGESAYPVGFVLFPAGNSAYPAGLVLSPPGKVLILQDSCCPRRE